VIAVEEKEHGVEPSKLEPPKYRMRVNSDKTPASVGVTNGFFAAIGTMFAAIGAMIREIFS
jgi:hypothetical protein